MRRTESEILNDPDIWDASESDDDYDGSLAGSAQESEGAHSRQDDGAGPGGQADAGDTQEMARYLVERAPTLGGSRSGSGDIESLWRKTASERTLILRREQAIKGLCELCVLRCIRPDHLIEGMDRFVLNVLDPQYLDFRADILAKWEA